jgi:hypothetical protein
LARALLAAPLLGRGAGARASAEPRFAAPLLGDGATLLVAGAEHGRLDRWSALMAPALCRFLPAGTAMRRHLVGGDDGVTGANQFEARATPDGRTVLLAPGAAAMAWLTGDPRAHFDATRWVPVMAGWTSGIVASRLPMAALQAGARLRIAAAGPAGADLPALLGLDMLGIAASPVFRVDGFPAAMAAVAARGVDAVFVHGESVPQRVERMAAAGLLPLFALGTPDEAGGTRRDRMFPEVPTFSERLMMAPGPGLAHPLYPAWRAAAAAAQLDFGLVLPQLTPAAMVALWRRAGAGVAAAPEMQPVAGAGVRPAVAPAPGTASLAPDAAAMLDLRHWLAARYNWRPA